MDTRARQNGSDEGGFIIIEVLVSAIILAIVAGAVLTLITATTRSSASGRTHATAYGLAQEDQARLRTFRISQLNGLEEPNEETIGGTNYKIESTGIFVNNATGTVSCTESNASADYVEITSTVSAPTLRNPISIQSIISPSSGSLDPSHGTISFQVNNAAGTGGSGVTVKGRDRVLSAPGALIEMENLPGVVPAVTGGVTATGRPWKPAPLVGTVTLLLPFGNVPAEPRLNVTCTPPTRLPWASFACTANAPSGTQQGQLMS